MDDGAALEEDERRRGLQSSRRRRRRRLLRRMLLENQSSSNPAEVRISTPVDGGGLLRELAAFLSQPYGLASDLRVLEIQPGCLRLDDDDEEDGLMDLEGGDSVPSTATSAWSLFSRAVADQPTLGELVLSRNGLTDRHVEVLADALFRSRESGRGSSSSRRSRLSKLVLAGNAIGEAGVRALVGVHAPPLGGASLDHLDLSGNRSIGEGGCGNLAASFRDGLLANLQILNLDGCCVGDGGALVLARGLEATGSSSASRLRVLTLRCNSIRNRGAVALARSLRRNASLEELDLSANCGISDPSVVGEFDETLRGPLNCTLTSVKLYLTALCHNSGDGGNGELHHPRRLEGLCENNRRLQARYGRLARAISESATNSIGPCENGQHNQHQHQHKHQMQQQQQQQMQQQHGILQPCLWSIGMEPIGSKPDLLYGLLRDKPELSSFRCTA